MRHILKFAALALSVILATPVLAGGVGCFGHKGSCGNGNGNGGNNGGGGGNKVWRHNDGGQNWRRHDSGGFRFKPQNRRDPDRRTTRRDDRPVIVENNNGGGHRKWHRGDGQQWRDQNSGGTTIIKKYFPQQGGDDYDDYDRRRWSRNDDGTNLILGAAALGMGLGIIDALQNQPSPPPDYYDQPYDEPLPQRRVYVEPAPQLDVFPDPPVLKTAPASKQKTVINQKKADKAAAKANAKANSDSHTTINNNIVIVTKDGTAPAAITTDGDGNAVTLEEACKAKNGTYYLGTDGLPKCNL